MTKSQAKAVIAAQRAAVRWRWTAAFCVAAAVTSAFVGQARNYWALPFVLGLGAVFAYLAAMRCEMGLLTRPMIDEAERVLSPAADNVEITT